MSDNSQSGLKTISLFENDTEKTTYKTITTEEVVEHFYPSSDQGPVDLYDVSRPSREQIEAVLDYLFESGHLEDSEVVEDLVDVDLEEGGFDAESSVESEE